MGTYHLTANGETSWYQYAQLVRTEALTLGFPLAVENLRPISSDQWPTAAERPLNSRLDTGKLRQLLGVQFPDWRDEVKQVIRQMLTRGNP